MKPCEAFHVCLVDPSRKWQCSHIYRPEFCRGKDKMPGHFRHYRRYWGVPVSRIATATAKSSYKDNCWLPFLFARSQRWLGSRVSPNVMQSQKTICFCPSTSPLAITGSSQLSSRNTPNKRNLAPRKDSKTLKSMMHKDARRVWTEL